MTEDLKARKPTMAIATRVAAFGLLLLVLGGAWFAFQAMNGGRLINLLFPAVVLAGAAVLLCSAAYVAIRSGKD